MRHAIALVLLGGWLWMQPPLDGSPKFIKQWQHVKSFDQARRCESARSARFKRLEEEGAPVDELTQVLNSRCVPADYIYPPK